MTKLVSPQASMLPCPQCGAIYAAGQQYCSDCGFPIGTVASQRDDRFIGRQLPGGYHILDLISVGGMGRVYRAEQSMLGRTVAVKIIHPHLLSDENSALRFLTEARAASQLNHPNSIAVFDFGRTDDGQPYMVMEFLRGKDLARVAYEEGPLPFGRIVDVLRQVLAALGEAHDLEIVHRDLKPENIILEPLRRGGDFVKVLDFGLAKLKADTASPSVTSPGIVCGTPDYMAPEQGRGDPIDGRSDLYAVGVVFFQLLTGRLPFEAESPTQVVMMHLSIPVPDPRQIAPDRHIPAPLVDVCFKALAKDPDQRFRDALEFSDALRDALALADSVRPESRSSRMSLVPGNFVICRACNNSVPQAKFCCECASPLTGPTGAPETGVTTGLPLPLVGRDDDLSWLEDRRDEATRALVGLRLVGESGAGKTRLLCEFLERSEACGDVVVRASPDPYWAEVAFHTLRSLVLGLTRLTGEQIEQGEFHAASVEARRGLEEIFTGLPRKEDKRTPVERRNALAEALRWALKRGAALANRSVLIVAVDELHRVDGPSRQAIADAMTTPPDCAGIVLATHLPGFDPGWGAGHVRALGSLPTVAISRALPGNRQVERLRPILEQLGNAVLPLYLEQLIRYMHDVGGEPPLRLADLIAGRFDVLGPNARLALQALVVLGDEIDPRALARLLPKALDIEETLDELEQAGMVLREGSRVSTAHPLIHEIVLLGIPAAARRELHAKALHTWEKRSAPIEARAIHAYYAQDSFQALLLLEQVGDRAARRGDIPTEVLALRRGLEIARQEISRGELDDPLQAVLIFGRKLGTALTKASAYADAEGVLREALDVAGPNSPDRARVLAVLADVAHGRHRRDEALSYIDQAIETAKQSGARDLEAELQALRTTRER